MSDAPPALSIEERTALQAGADLYMKRLEAMAKEEFDLGQEENGKRTIAERKRVEDHAADAIAEPEKAKAEDRLFLRKGLSLFLRNLKAAMGTMTGLGKMQLAADFKAEADRLEETLVPRLLEQASLKLETKPGKDGPKGKRAKQGDIEDEPSEEKPVRLTKENAERLQASAARGT